MPQTFRTQRRIVEANGQRVRPSELIIMVTAVVLVILGIRYYLNYRQSPQYVVSSYLGSMKSGNVASQYDLISEIDKKSLFPDQDTYEKKAQQSRGYTERIADIIVKADSVPIGDSDHTKVEATVSIRELSKNITDTAPAKAYTDKYYVHKDSDGKWRVVLTRSGDGVGNLHLYEATPNPPGSSYN